MNDNTTTNNNINDHINNNSNYNSNDNITKADSQVLALFDFDGTISKKDSFFDFIKFTNNPFKIIGGLIYLSPTLLLYLLDFMPNWRTKEIVLEYFYKGIPQNVIEALGMKYCEIRINNILKQTALDKINWHQKQNHRIILVTASLDIWLAEWTKRMKIELIATKPDYKNNVITGKIKGKNCWGPEKVIRIKSALNLSDYNIIYAYGDSRGDKEMLEIATHPNYRNFK